MKLFVYHTPEQTPGDRVPDCAVVIDVLRATTTIVTAINAGAEAVQTFSDINVLLTTSEQWAVDKRLRLGERGGKQVPGCDLGNSPLDCTEEVVAGKRLFLSTTNGTRAFQRVEAAPTVVAGTLANRQAVVDFLQAQAPETVWLVGSGWEGSFSLEDTVCAGAIALPLWEKLGDDILGNDETVAAIALYQQWQNRLLDLFYLASHGQRLLGLDNTADLKYCAQIDTIDLVPIQTEKGVLSKP